MAFSKIMEIAIINFLSTQDTTLDCKIFQLVSVLDLILDFRHGNTIFFFARIDPKKVWLEGQGLKIVLIKH